MTIGGMKSFISLTYLILLVCDLYGNGLLCDAFSSGSQISVQARQRTGSTRTTSFLNAENDEETAEAKEKSPYSEPISLYELAEMEARASKRTNDRLLLPYRLGGFVTNAAWFFLISGYVLNAFGYGYIRGEHGITIGTMDELNFQIEMTKTTREAMENSVDAVTRSQIEVGRPTMK